MIDSYYAFILTGKLQKVVDLLIYLGSIISSTESDVSIHLVKIWITIDMLSIIWKSDLSDKIKRGFLQALAVSILLYGCATFMLTKRNAKKLDRNYSRILCIILNTSRKQHSTKQQLYGHLIPSQKPFNQDKQNMQDTTGEARDT